MMRKIKLAVIALITILSMASCDMIKEQFTKKNAVEYLPYQAEKDGKWGMIGLDGKVLFAEEFKNMPTAPQNERFMVLNKDSLWEYYTLESKPKKIGDEYVQGTSFAPNGLAIVVRKEHHIEVINKEGKVVQKFDNLDGKPLLWINCFDVNGLAVFCTQEGFLGCVDANGQVVIKPKYRQLLNNIEEGNYFVAVEDCNAHVSLNDPMSLKREILDNKGNVVAKLGANKYLNVYAEQEGLFPAQVVEGNDTIMGILNAQGEWAVKPSKNTKSKLQIKYGHFIYYDGDSYGVKDIQGNIKVRPKYDRILFTENNGRLIVVSEDKRKLIDFEDNQIGEDTWLACWNYLNEYTLAKVSQNSWTSINKDGKEVKDVPELYNIDRFDYFYSIRNQYVDVNALAKGMRIEENSIMGISLDMTAMAVHKLALELNDSLFMGLRIPLTAEGYGKDTYTQNFELRKCIENTAVNVVVNMNGNIIKVDNSKNSFSQAKPTQISIYINTKGEPIETKGHDLYEALKGQITKYGDVIASNNNAVVIKGKKNCIAAFDVKKSNVVACLILPFSFIPYAHQAIQELE